MIVGWQGITSGETFSTADITGAVQSVLQGASEGVRHLPDTIATAVSMSKMYNDAKNVPCPSICVWA